MACFHSRKLTIGSVGPGSVLMLSQTAFCTATVQGGCSTLAQAVGPASKYRDHSLKTDNSAAGIPGNSAVDVFAR